MSQAQQNLPMKNVIIEKVDGYIQNKYEQSSTTRRLFLASFAGEGDDEKECFMLNNVK